MKYLKKIDKENDKYTIKDTPNLVLVNSTKKVLYNITPTCVFIQHINGIIYTTSEWQMYGFTGDVANGVAVINDNVRFVIAKDNLDNCKWSSNYETIIDGIPNVDDSVNAKNDLEGFNNTALMLETDTSGAGYACANYIFPNNQKGYLGSAGEWWIAYTNKEEINEALSLIDAEPMLNGSGREGYWTSTQYEYGSKNYAWVMEWNTDYTLWDAYKGSAQPVRPFTTINI